MRAALAWCTLLVGCSDDPVRSMLDGPRVLAIVAEPPALAPSSSTTLAAITTLDGIAVTPDRIAWRACSPYAVIVDPVRDCEGERAFELPVDAAGRGVADADTIAAHFAIAIPAEPPADACALPPLALTVVAEIDLAGTRLVAKKELAIAAGLARTNPAIVHARLAGAPFDPGASFSPGTTVALSADIAIESFDTVCDAGTPRREEVRVVVYPGPGATASDESFDVVDRDGVLTAGSVDLELPEVAGPLPLWLVAVDESGGAAVMGVSLDVR